MKKKYLALTIGPIYKTISKAKKPKQLFAGSYVFSYVMRKIIENFKDRNFITPYIKNENIFKEKELGLFHDRFIFESQNGDKEKLEKVVNEVLEDLAQKLNVNFRYLKEYFQINYIEKELKEKDNPILEISPYLDTEELFFQTSQHSDEVLKSLTNKEGFLLENKNIVDDLKKISSKRYFAIVHADGDNMSKVIENKDKIEDISRSLFEYCIESNKKIKKFGGQTIFAGGDDLLFFAPVYRNDRTIFDLCDEISDVFDKKIGDNKAHLSFGVSIQYVKFPLYEALEESRRLLFAKAKNDNKNNIAFKVQKHSGQSFEAVIHKGNENIYKKFSNFTSTLEEKDEVGNFLHSIHHKIDTYKNIINQIGYNRDKLENFFKNYFNENYSEYETFFKNLVDYMELIYKEENIKNEDKLNLIYATLRFMKFIKGDKE